MEIKSCKVHDIFSILKMLWSIRFIGITDYCLILLMYSEGVVPSICLKTRLKVD